MANPELATKQYVDDVAGSAITVDQTYNPESANAQSGIAVAQAVETCSPAIVITSDTAKTLSIPDSAEGNIKGLTAYGESSQDGTPTPDSPVEIVSVENPVISVYGKNLFDVENMKLTASNAFNNNLNYAPKFENGIFYSGGQSGNIAGKSFYVEVHGGQVTFSCKRISNEICNGEIREFDSIDEDGIMVNSTILTNIENMSTNYTVTLNPTKRYIGFAFYSATKYGTQLVDMQIEIGSVATSYQPYIEPQTLTIPYTFRGLKNSSGEWTARDELRVGEGKAEIVRNVDYLDCTSDLNWRKSGSTICDIYYFVYFDTAVEGLQPTLCTHFKGIPSVSLGNSYLLDKGVWFAYAPHNTTTVEDWKSFLDTANMSVIFASETSTVEDITATEAGQVLLKLYTNYPNTSVISDIDLDITYKADTKNYIDNKIATLTALTLEG